MRNNINKQRAFITTWGKTAHTLQKNKFALSYLFFDLRSV